MQRLSASQLIELKAYADASDRVGYYSYLDEHGFSYAGRALGVVCMVWLLAYPAFAQSFPEPSQELCAPYRHGPVIERRMPVYDAEPTADPASHYWVDVFLDPEYEFNPMIAGIPNVDELPKKDLLLDINIADGRPFTEEKRRQIRPQKREDFILLLVGGVADFDIERILAVYSTHAGADLIDNDDPSSSYYYATPPFVRMGEYVGGFERIDFVVPEQTKVDPPRYDWYVAFNADSDVIATMECALPGTFPVPRCSLSEKARYWEMKSHFRRDLMDRGTLIRKHMQDFATCLTWKGE